MDLEGAILELLGKELLEVRVEVEIISDAKPHFSYSPID